MSRECKPRTPGTIEDGLMRIIGVLGIDLAACVVKKSESHVRGWTDPDNDREIGLKQAMQLEAEYIRRTGMHSITAIWVKAMNAIAASEGPKPATEPLPVSLMDVTSHVGLLAGSVRAALSDNRICRADKDAVLRAVQNMRHEIDQLEKSVVDAFGGSESRPQLTD